MKPLLDVVDLLTDPDFVDTELQCLRFAQTVGENGISIDTRTTFPFVGVVTSGGGDELHRTPTGERIEQQIKIITRFLLMDGSPGFTADLIMWNGSKYTITQTDDYSRYGRGFVQATAELIPLTG